MVKVPPAINHNKEKKTLCQRKHVEILMSHLDLTGGISPQHEAVGVLEPGLCHKLIVN